MGLTNALCYEIYRIQVVIYNLNVLIYIYIYIVYVYLTKPQQNNYI